MGAVGKAIDPIISSDRGGKLHTQGTDFAGLAFRPERWPKEIKKFHEASKG
jgi:uncharacterized protein YozE (UPF0346 family)